MTPTARKRAAWLRNQTRGLGSLLAATAIVLGVLSYAMASTLVPRGDDPSAQVQDPVVTSRVIEQKRTAELFVNARGTGRQIAYVADIEVLGWKDGRGAIVDASVRTASALPDGVKTGRAAAESVTQAISKQLVGERILAAVDSRAKLSLPKRGRARVHMLVTPRDRTATVLIDSVVDTGVVSPLTRVSAASVAGMPAVGASAAVARVTELSTYWGAPGTRVTLRGTGFGRAAKDRVLVVKGVVTPVRSWRDTSVTFVVPRTMKSGGYVGVRIKGRTSNGLYFVPFNPPTLTAITPEGASPGSTVRITGRGFGRAQADGWVTFAGSSAQVLTWTDTAITVAMPRDAQPGYAGVVANGLTSNGLLFAPYGTPLLDPASARVLVAGGVVRLTGSGFGASPGQVTIGGVPVSTLSWKPREITLRTPSDLKGGYVGVIRQDGLVSNGVWGSVVPRMEALSTWWAQPGGTVEVTGGGFGTQQGDKCVYLAGAPMEVLSWADDRIVARVPSGGTSGYVGVGTSAACSAGRYLLVETPATVAGLSAAWASPGDRLTIDGAGFGPRASTTRVVMAGTECPVLSWSDTQIVVSVPVGAQSGYVGVVRNGVTSNGIWLVSLGPSAP